MSKGQIISKRLLVSLDSSKKRTNERIRFYCLTVLKTNLFVRFLEESEDTKKLFRNYLTFNTVDGEIISWNVEKVKCDFIIILATLCNNITLILNVWSSGNRKTVVNIAVGQKWDFLYLFFFMIVEFSPTIFPFK